ncbi:MAG: 50S ribosomal protein L18 [Methylococcaceae bacterium]|nr:50S ribosomal protein L18 [Methylococcaceae bacterium]MCI0668126.1 50S ribosomal protein L18 [Methylococcaceae bacterium]MCI0733165.1 50S ribosomal protein L18 [Methylococcaceae bacterium]
MGKNENRLRRAAKTRARIRKSETKRLTVHRTPRHIYAQINNEDGSRTLVSASTVQASIRDAVGNTGNISAAQAVGKALAEKALESGILVVAFDRSGYKYHGRVKALAEAAREVGLKF